MKELRDKHNSCLALSKSRYFPFYFCIDQEIAKRSEIPLKHHVAKISPRDCKYIISVKGTNNLTNKKTGISKVNKENIVKTICKHVQMVTPKHTKPSLKKGRSSIQIPSPVSDDDEDEYISKILSDDVIEPPKSQIIQKNTSIELNDTNSNSTIIDQINAFLENHVKLDEKHLDNIRDTIRNTNNTQNNNKETEINANSDKDFKEKKEQVILRKPAGLLSKMELQEKLLEGEENKVASALSQLNLSHNNTNESRLEESQKDEAPFLQHDNFLNKGNDSKTTLKEIDEKSISLKPVSSNDNATGLHKSVDQPDRNRSEITKRMESLKAEKILQNDNLTQIIENMIEKMFKEKEREKDKLISSKAESVDLSNSTIQSHQNDSLPEVKAESDDEKNRTTLKHSGIQLSSNGNYFYPINHQHDKAYYDSNKVLKTVQTEGSNYSNSEQPFQNKATNLNETSNNLDKEIELKTPFEKLKHRIKMLDNELEKAEQELKEREAEDHVKEVLLFA